MRALRWFQKLQGDSRFMASFHGWATVVWFVLAFPICIFLSQSVPFLVFISVYAIVVAHWASYQAGRVEVKQDEGQDSEQ